MYLKSIRANGFKSFADKIELDINKGITAVVGPNGSGKSNIVDAVRWVMGEQSVKALRGDASMSDVIFAGSGSRQALSRAWVSLTFDNTDHYLKSEFNEIEIKRVVYKTGENEYYINNSKVRLKDITDLFLDSGAGKESFNIISQGAVVDVVNSKPEDRRSIFEEAAGVLKYKKRKDESFRKLQKTNENIARVNLLIDELLTTLEPLKQQSIVAQKYLDYKESLEQIEIALLANDITQINVEYNEIKEKVKQLTTDIEGMEFDNSSGNSKIDQLKLESLKLDDEIEKKNAEVLKIINEISDLQSKKQITIERKKYEVDDTKLQNNIIALKEEILGINNNVEGLNKDLAMLEGDINTKNLQELELSKVKDKLEDERNRKVAEISSLNKDVMNLNNKIDIINENIMNDTKLPFGVKSVINNIRLRGICGVLGKLIEVDNKYGMAIETALGANINVIVVEDVENAKEAIEYLKENKMGRATFYPISVIKPRFIEQRVLDLVKNEKGFVGIGAELVKYDKKYKDIVFNQLGNVLIVEDIDSLNKIAKLIDYKYRLVSLEGEISQAGGALTGGTLKNNNGLINQKKELETFQNDLAAKSSRLKMLEIEMNNLEQKYREALINYENNEREILLLNEKKKQKKEYLETVLANLNAKQAELDGTLNVSNNSLDKELDEILNNYYQAVALKENLEKELNKLKSERSELGVTIADLERKYREVNAQYNQKQNELKMAEVKVGKLDVKLDNLLMSLNENYGMTYERAKEDYELDVDADMARVKVNNLKVKIKDLGEVNTGSIAEYERLNTRYEFLSTQRNDLEKSVSELLAVIGEMDEIMKKQFLETFLKIKDEFEVVFKKLFKGGEGVLELTDPDNILETGINVSALPPGKKLNSIALLSGGEKTLTAIALLFAILNVKPVPFVILDEVEAALDEANVDAFGNYLQTRKERSQFIIITHKKRTMEYADALYGITMQESGVSKLVSVKLEDK